VRDDDLALLAVRPVPPALRGLPAHAVAGLAEAFATEVAERLPRLQDAVATGSPALLEAAVRDAHSLGSSAAVLGEADASRAARAVEALLLGWRAGDAPPPVEALRLQVDALTALLHGWRS
jgi:HPt (histidine-containing phosphotransfer) domain-containing protein